MSRFLDIENKIGVSLTKSKAMTPTASVSGLYFGHPDAPYFNLRRIKSDHLEAYAHARSEATDESRDGSLPYSSQIDTGLTMHIATAF